MKMNWLRHEKSREHFRSLLFTLIYQDLISVK